VLINSTMDMSKPGCSAAARPSGRRHRTSRASVTSNNAELLLYVPSGSVGLGGVISFKAGYDSVLAGLSS
jgi:hypothetical protein